VCDFERRVALPASVAGLPVVSAELAGGVLEVEFERPDTSQ
jgi:HSP20 family molecular chaperone IbpA